MYLYPEMRRLLDIAGRGDANVLLTGPTGCGKSSLAREIHEKGCRAGKPFIAVNLATLHEGTFESELFGHERGAFTGAEQRRVGKLELAHGGTVFLDEVGELSPRLQGRLLEFLQSRRITPVGGNREQQLDVRVISASHRNLSLGVTEGTFREDLLHRLRVISLRLRPLSERTDELDAIIHGILDELCKKSGRSVLRLSEEVAERLETHAWPGNFRELRNLLEYAVLASDSNSITVADLPGWFLDQADIPSVITHNKAILGTLQLGLSLDYQAALSEFEKEYLRRALQRFRGRINRTARGIGINKTTLLRRMQTYGLRIDENEPFSADFSRKEELRASM